MILHLDHVGLGDRLDGHRAQEDAHGVAAPGKDCLSLSLSTTRSAIARECSTFSWVLKNWRSRTGLPVDTSASVTLSEVGFGGITCSSVRAW